MIVLSKKDKALKKEGRVLDSVFCILIAFFFDNIFEENRKNQEIQLKQERAHPRVKGLWGVTYHFQGMSNAKFVIDSSW